jgi:antitoxin ParD1/3/4
MDVSLTPELEKFVGARVESGRYTSASEVVSEALRLLEEQEISRDELLKGFRGELTRRLDALDRGEMADPEAVREQFKHKSDERRKSRA